MTAKKISVKDIGGPFNLGPARNWSEEDVEFLVSQGASKNEVGYLQIPLDLIKGEVLLGIGQRQAEGEAPPELFIGGRKLNRSKRRSFLESAE